MSACAITRLVPRASPLAGQTFARRFQALGATRALVRSNRRVSWRSLGLSVRDVRRLGRKARCTRRVLAQRAARRRKAWRAVALAKAGRTLPQCFLRAGAASPRKRVSHDAFNKVTHSTCSRRISKRSNNNSCLKFPDLLISLPPVLFSLPPYLLSEQRGQHVGRDLRAVGLRPDWRRGLREQAIEMRRPVS
jgi:hypothetical protein